jgi:hypothetical protein
LWVSVPDKAGSLAEAAGSSSLIVPDGCMDLIVINSQILIAGADSTVRMFYGSAAPTVGLRFDPGVLPQLPTRSAAELADRVTPLDAVIGGRWAEVGNAGDCGTASVMGFSPGAARYGRRPGETGRAGSATDGPGSGLGCALEFAGQTVTEAAAAEVGYADAANLRRDERSLIG